MKSPSILNFENLKFGRFSKLLKAKIPNNEKSSSAEDLRSEITSPEFEEKIKLLVKKDLSKYYKPQTLDQVLHESTFLILNNYEDEVIEDEFETEIIEDELESEHEILKDNFIFGDEKLDEISKIQSRIPGWFKKPQQINSRILIAYMELLGDDKSIPYYKLEAACRSIKTFQNNYVQMKSFGEHNHAKVFEEVGSRITLWEPTREFVKKEYEKFKKRHR